jgi:raffinose/stachyose/melibiose transport system permease protein
MATRMENFEMTDVETRTHLKESKQQPAWARGITLRPGDHWYTGWLYLLPGFLLFVLFVMYPLVLTLWYSLHEWAGVGTPVWTGLKNYLELFQDTLFWQGIFHNLLFVIFYSLIPIVLGLALSSILSQKWFKGMTLFRTLLFLPQILPMVLIGIIWRWLYSPVNGPINQFLKTIGLGLITRPWLGDFDWALPSLGFIASWYYYGFCMVIFLAGIQKIDPHLYDAASLDGASALRQFWHVTLPDLRREIGVVTLFTFISALKIFDLVYVTTRGGPGDSTLVTSLYLYEKAFRQKAVGYGASIAVMLTLFTIVITILLRRYQGNR